jgi:hypothetical protein
MVKVDWVIWADPKRESSINYDWEILILYHELNNRHAQQH